MSVKFVIISISRACEIGLKNPWKKKGPDQSIDLFHYYIIYTLFNCVSSTVCRMLGWEEEEEQEQ